MTQSVQTPKRFAAKGAFIAAALLSAGYAYTFYTAVPELPVASPATELPATPPAPEISAASPAAAQDVFDTSRLPRISGAAEIYASPATTIFVSPDTVAMTADTIASGLAETGWQRYEAPFTAKAETPDQAIMMFKKDAQGLNAFITLPPAQGNKTSVQYSGVPFEQDLPFPADAREILFDPSRPYLSCFTSAPVAEAMRFLNGELIARGWVPWSAKDKAKKPDGAIQDTDNGQFSYFMQEGRGAVIALVQLQKDGRTIAKIEPVPASVLTASQEAEEKPESAAPQPSAAAREMNEAFDKLATDILNQAREATAEAMSGIAKGHAPAPKTAPGGAPLAALSDTVSPIPMPATADDIEIDADDGAVDFRSSSSVRDLTRFYRTEMNPAGWREQPTVIDKDTMAALRFSKDGEDISITIMQMGKSAKVSATGSGLANAALPATAGATQAKSASNEAHELTLQDVSGFPVPAPNSLNGSETSLYRIQVNARVTASVADVLKFYRRELGKRDGWTEATGAIVELGRAIVNYDTSEGPARLTLTSDGADTVVTLFLRKEVLASKAGMLPKPGNVKLMFGNMLDEDAEITIGKTTVKIPAGSGAKKADGPTLEIAPGKQTVSLARHGKTAQTEDVDVASGDVWGLMVGPGGVLALQMY